jgi:hypothetical protein
LARSSEGISKALNRASKDHYIVPALVCYGGLVNTFRTRGPSKPLVRPCKSLERFAKDFLKGAFEEFKVVLASLNSEQGEQQRG